MLEDDHVEAARNALLQSNGKLNDWETSFLSSMLHIRWPSARQLTVLEELVWKAKAPKPRAKSRRGRGAPR
jgi:hypothetical protein